MGIWITLWSAMKYVLRHMEECLPDLMVSKFRPIHPIHRFCSDFSLELIGKLCPTFGGCGGVRVKIWGATVRQVNQNLCSCCFSFYANPRICGGFFFSNRQLSCGCQTSNFWCAPLFGSPLPPHTSFHINPGMCDLSVVCPFYCLSPDSYLAWIRQLMPNFFARLSQETLIA